MGKGEISLQFGLFNHKYHMNCCGNKSISGYVHAAVTTHALYYRPVKHKHKVV